MTRCPSIVAAPPVLALALLLGSAACSGGGGGGETEPEIPAGIDEASYELFGNPGDPLALRVTTEDGSRIEVFGEKDDEARIAAVETVRHQTAAQRTTDTETWLHFDSSTGALRRLVPEEGTAFELSFRADGQVEISAVSAGGDVQVAAVVAGSPDARRPIPARRPARQASGRAGQVDITVTRCGEALEGADVYLLVDFFIPPTTSTLQYPVRPTSTPGLYRASVPLAEPPLSRSQARSACEAVFTAAGVACAGQEALTASIPGTCATVVAALEALDPIPGDALLFGPCTAALTAYQAYCSTAGAAPVGSGGAGPENVVCPAVEEALDRGLEAAAGTVTLRAFADVPGESRAASAPTTFGAFGAPPEIPIDLGSSPRIVDVRADPFQPVAGQPYELTTRVRCAGGGTVDVTATGEQTAFAEGFRPESDALRELVSSVTTDPAESEHRVAVLALGPVSGGDERSFALPFRCDDSCVTARNGFCEDGGPNSGPIQGPRCAIGTDCDDCRAPAPICEENRDCVALGLGEVCTGEGCFPCGFDADCDESAIGPICDGGACVPEIPADCPVDDVCDLACPAGPDPDCEACGPFDRCVAGCPSEDIDCQAGDFVVLSYVNTDCIPARPRRPPAPAAASISTPPGPRSRSRGRPAAPSSPSRGSGTRSRSCSPP